jgi:hypothetical protein
MLLVLMLLLVFGGLILGVLALPALVALGGIAVAGLGALGAIVVPFVALAAGFVASGVVSAFLLVVTGLGYAASYAYSGIRVLVTGRRETVAPVRQLQPAASTVSEIPYDVAAQCQEQKLVPCPI